MHDGGVIPCSSVLNMLPQIAERLLLLSRVLPMQAPHDEQAASVLAGTWQAPGLFCSLWTRVHAPHVPPPQRYLLLRAWPLVTHKDPLPSEPDVAPQVAIRIGLGELEEAARYLAELDGLIESKAWEGCKRPRSMIRTVVPGELEGRRRYKREVILWRFAPEFDDPILEAIQRVRRMGDAERVQKLTAFFESRQPRREAYLATREANWWRTIYIHSDKYKTPLVTLLLTVILRQEGVIPHTEEESLDTHAVQYLKSLRWAEDGRAYLAMLRNMGGNETWLTLPFSMWVICRPQGTRRLEGYVANASGIASG